MPTQVITGCGNEFDAPYAYTLPVTFDAAAAGMTCDPTHNPNP